MAVQIRDDEALDFAVALIQTGLSSSKSHEERYEYITKRLQEAPFFALDRCKTDTREWHQQKVTAKDALKKFLPERAFKKFVEQTSLSDVQSVMDLHTYKDFFSNIWTNEVSGSKKLTDLIHISDPDPVTSKISVYFIRLVAEYSGSRRGFTSDVTRSLTAEYQYMEFSALTTVLKEIMRQKQSDVVVESMKWLEQKKKKWLK